MPAFTATRLQIATYLLGVCPFSIAFLVFLNSSVSFVVTDLIGREDGVGNAVGNLGFADELIALVACPVWGLLSDRIGVRTVCVAGYSIICLALVLFVQAKNVYPQLLLGRLFFSVGGAAAATMVTAVLPTMSHASTEDQNSSAARLPSHRHAQAPSITSELTITPARFATSAAEDRVTSREVPPHSARAASTSRMSGFVGMFTGLGALLALFVFLPLPAAFQKRGYHPAIALQYSYYIVAIFALFLSITCLLGLRNLKSEEGKSWNHPFQQNDQITLKVSIRHKLNSGRSMITRAFLAGFGDSSIGIGYIGGFVARASSVGISLFIPLFINASFTSSKLCHGEKVGDTPAGLPDIKRKCPQAYLVAAEMTGISQMVALITAPLFGYWSARVTRKSIPLAAASLAGIVGYPMFAARFHPSSADKGSRAMAFIAVCLIGFSQIGAIVCSLSSLSLGILTNDDESKLSQPAPEHIDPTAPQNEEHRSLLGKYENSDSLANVKGSVAGIYSFFGGAAILILTKAGGALFDRVSPAAPFHIMAVFNAILLGASVVVALGRKR